MTYAALQAGRRRWRGVALIWIVVAAAGCGIEKNPYQPTDPDSARKAAEQLLTLPTLAATRAQLITTIEQVGRQISAIAPETIWSWRHEDSRGGCTPPYEQSTGQDILLASYVSDVPIAERHWRPAYEAAARAAHGLGLEQVTVFKNQPDNHDVQFSDETGTVLRFGSQKAALLTGNTGCRLPQR